MTDTSKTTTDYYLLCLYTHNSLVSPFLSHASPFPSYRDRRVRLTGTRGSWRVAASPPSCKGGPVVSRTAPRAPPTRMYYRRRSEERRKEDLFALLLCGRKRNFLRHPNQLLLLTVE